MRYEYNHSIQFDLDHLTQYEDVSDLEEKKMELDEVYRKAEAFDEIVKSFYEIRKDMKDKMVSYELGYQTIGTEVAKHIKQCNSKEAPQ